jgi:catechol 2,3-dioxygenase-like lactoylglutathione lyase family enzyme
VRSSVCRASIDVMGPDSSEREDPVSTTQPSLPARVSLVTLGVTDLRRSTEFYRALGWDLSSASVDGEVSFFRTAGAVVALWDTSALAADAGLPSELPSGVSTGFRGVAQAINLESREAVDAGFAAAERAGARITKPPTRTDWGGYSGYFADPDGHLWELAHNPFWPLDERGLPTLP